MISPIQCCYAPKGEYIKDHTLLYHDGWWHLYAISGTEGYYHGYNGNEETVSWSISKDLVNWEMRGHVLHASQRKGAFDQHEIWAPFCLKTEEKFYQFYTGIIHPHRPLYYDKPQSDSLWVYEGHKETIGIAVSDDLTDWVKISDIERGAGIPGRDPHVVWDDKEKRWLLYSTGMCNRNQVGQVFVSESKDLCHWHFGGTCALFPSYNEEGGQHESVTVMRHPKNEKWIIMANFQFNMTDDPLTFLDTPSRIYSCLAGNNPINMGVAGEMIEWQGKWYRSGFTGAQYATKLCFTEIEWDPNGAFDVVTPSAWAQKY